LPPNTALLRNPPFEEFLWWGVTAHRDGWMELTPQSGPKIVAILKGGIGPHAFLIYRCGAAQRQAVRPPVA
jgi:hypothetical protein